MARKIAQYTLEGEFIRTFESAAEAERVLGYKKDSVKSKIGKCCKLKQTFSCGYRWLYADDIPRAKELFEQHPLYDAKTHTFEEILEAAAGCKTKKEFRRKNKTLHSYAYEHGWLDKLGFKRAINPHKDNCYTVYAIPFYDTNTVYVGLTDDMERRWGEHNDPNAKSISGALKYSIETGIPMPEYPLIIEENLYVLEALYFEGFWENWYKSQGMNVLNKGKTGVGSGSLGGAVRRKNTEIFEAASSCLTKKEFLERFPNLYSLACRRNLIDKLGLQSIRRVKSGTYTEKHCYEIAIGCKTTKEFMNTDKSAHDIAARNGWNKKYWWLYDTREKPVVKTKGFLIKLYKSYSSCLLETGVSEARFRAYLKGKNPLNGSYYHYLDINDIEFDIPDFEHRYII